MSQKKIKDEYYNRLFKENLVYLSLADNYEEAINEWAYAGGGAECEPRHHNYFLKIQGELNLIEPEIKNACICTHYIEKNCYLRRLDNNDLIVVGNCCIKKFIPQEKSKRTCVKCGNPHKNKSNSICNQCRIVNCQNCEAIIKTNLAISRGYCQKCYGYPMLMGNYEGLYYRQVLNKDPIYCNYYYVNCDNRIAIEYDEYKDMKTFISWLKTNINFEPDISAYIMDCGKFKGLPYSEIMTIDAGYCIRILNVHNPSPLIKKFKNYLKDKDLDKDNDGWTTSSYDHHINNTYYLSIDNNDSEINSDSDSEINSDYIMEMGKHKGLAFGFIRKELKSYCDWFINNCTSTQECYKKFRQYLVKKGI